MILKVYKDNKTQQQNENIRARAGCGLPLTARERAKYLLFLATVEEVATFLKMEVKKGF